MNLVMIVERIMRYSPFFFKVIATNERTLMDQGDMYKSKLVRYILFTHIHNLIQILNHSQKKPQVIEYDKFDSMEKAYNEMKEMNQKKTEELEKSIEQRVEKIQQEFDK